MTKNRIVLYIGLFLFLIPFLGFPSKWEAFFQIVFGLILMSISFSATIKRRAAVRRPRRKKESESISVVTSTAPSEQLVTQDNSNE